MNQNLYAIGRIWSRFIKRFSILATVLSVIFFSMTLSARPMWEISDRWTCKTAFFLESDRYGKGIYSYSMTNIEKIDFKKGTISKYLGQYQRTLRGTILKRFYLENADQGVYESTWFSNYEEMGNVSSGTVLKIPGETRFYKGKLALNTKDGQVYANAEICSPEDK